MNQRFVCRPHASVLAAIATLGVCLSAHAQSPINYVEGFESDSDAYVPPSPSSSPTAPYGATGATPGVQLPLPDWGDERNWPGPPFAGQGLAEEIPSNDPLFGNVLANAGSNLAILYRGPDDSYGVTNFADGPVSRVGRQTAFPAGASQWAYQTDIFAEPVPTPGGGLDYFWWTNAVSDATGTGPFAPYRTESGFQIHPGPASWSFLTTGGIIITTLPTGVWYHLETVFDVSSGFLEIHHRIFNANRTTELASYTIPAASVYLGPHAAADVGGPRYSWFSVWNNNIVDHIYVDNVGTRSGAGAVDLVASDSCLNASESQVVVEIRMSDVLENVVGGEFHLTFDNAALSVASIAPGDAPFTQEIFEVISGNQIDYAVGVSPFSHPGTTADTVMARITFNILPGTERCSVADLVAWDTANVPPSRLSNDNGQVVPADYNDLGPITIDQVAPTMICPPNIVVNADAGACASGAVVLPAVQDFSTNPTIGATQAPGVWYTDRYAPFGFSSAVFDGSPRLKHSIDASACSPCRPPGFTSPFYDTQGRKYDTPGAQSMTIDLYVPASWATTGRRMAGFWGTGFNALNAVSGFPIIEFTSGPDGSGVPRFRGWDSTVLPSGAWVDMGLPTGFTYNRWYTLKIDLVAGNWVYRVGDLNLSVSAGTSVQIANVILQGHNNTAGVTYDIYWDNFATNHPTFYDNCDSNVTLTVLPVQPGNVYPVGVTNLVWMATDDCGNVTICNQSVTVNALNTVNATVELKNVFTAGITRGITFQFFNGGVLMDTRCADVTFTDHDSNGATPVRGTATFDANCGVYDCVTVRDTLHSLRRTISAAPEFTIVGTQYSIESTSSGANDDSLIGGNANDDRFVDILDFGTFAGQFGSSPGGNTPCPPAGPHTDFDGDGDVTAFDYTFIAANFLLSREVSCDSTLDLGGNDVHDEDGPITRISVRELQQRGLGHLIRADFNHDGWLDQQDIAVFLHSGPGQ
jgi:hypothetical protein